MWLDGSRLDAVGAALTTHSVPDVDQLLAEVLGSATSQAAIPTACPTCRRDLVRRPLPETGLYVSACPARHGAWITSHVLGDLHRFVDREATLAAKKRHRLRVLGRALVLVGVAAVAALMLTVAVATQWVSVPGAPAPTGLAREEWIYLQQLVTVLDRGIANRLHLETTLKTQISASEYAAGYAQYREQQLGVLASLRRLDVPANLKAVHDHIVAGGDRQIEFYEAFVAAKSGDPSIPRARMRRHPALVATDRELHAAYDLLKQRYPTLDQSLDQAIDQRLCAFDPLDDFHREGS